MISFKIPGQPVAKERARSFIRGNSIGHYTPVKTKNYEGLVKLVAFHAMKGKEIIKGPVRADINLYFQIPQSWRKSMKEAALNGQLRPTVKPDCSNIQKAIEDALNGIVWQDDKQIVDVSVKKFYSDKPMAIVEVNEI